MYDVSNLVIPTALLGKLPHVRLTALSLALPLWWCHSTGSSQRFLGVKALNIGKGTPEFLRAQFTALNHTQAVTPRTRQKTQRNAL